MCLCVKPNFKFMNIKLLPDFEKLPPLSKKGEFPLLFYFFKLKEADKEGINLRALMHNHGAKCLHWWTCEYTFIGEGDYWTHCGVFEITDKNAFLAATKASVSTPSVKSVLEAVENVQLYFAKAKMPPKLIWVLFKLLRPLGILLDTNKKSTTEKVLTAFDSEGGINPRRDQIERHLTNNRKTKAFMINLLQYKPKAIYDDPSVQRDISGRTAYTNIYGIVALRSVIMTGGDFTFGAQLGAPILENDAPKSTMGFWDDVIVMSYSDPSRLFSLKRMPGYGSALKHRTAGLLRTALMISK
jgi:hypothetical protein